MNILTEEQAENFYKLWIPLLDYVNKKYRLERAFYGMISQKGLPLDVAVKIATKLWSDVSVIDEYLCMHGSGMIEEDKGIIRSWKKAKSGRYIVDRHLYKGSVLVSIEDENVYVVKGIYSDWREMLNYGPVPQIIRATLIPYEDCIIHDGVIIPYNVLLGQGMAEWSKQVYLSAKKDGRLLDSLG